MQLEEASYPSGRFFLLLLAVGGVVGLVLIFLDAPFWVFYAAPLAMAPLVVFELRALNPSSSTWASAGEVPGGKAEDVMADVPGRQAEEEDEWIAELRDLVRAEEEAVRPAKAQREAEEARSKAEFQKNAEPQTARGRRTSKKAKETAKRLAAREAERKQGLTRRKKADLAKTRSGSRESWRKRKPRSGVVLLRADRRRGWSLWLEGDEGHPLASFKGKRLALLKACEYLAEHEGGEVVVFGKDDEVLRRRVIGSAAVRQSRN